MYGLPQVTDCNGTVGENWPTRIESVGAMHSEFCPEIPRGVSWAWRAPDGSPIRKRSDQSPLMVGVSLR